MNQRSRHLVTLAATLAFAGCADIPQTTPPEIRPVTIRSAVAPSPVQLEDVVARFDLSALGGSPSGVAVEPDTGRRLVLLEHGQIVDLETGDTLWTGSPSQGGTGFSDIVALGEGRVAITSVSDGYLVELTTGSVTPHFCYEPGWWDGQGEDPVQISQAVAHDASSGVIYAQPRTVTEGGFGEITESFVSAYDEATGADVAWWSIEDLGFVATGMAMLETGHAFEDAKLVLASQQTLYTFNGTTGDLTPAGDLASVDVEWVNGIAIDREAGTLLVADVISMQVVEIRLSALGL